MYGKAVRTQIKFLIGQKSFALVFSVLMVVMLRNFIENVLTFRGYDVISLYHPMKMLALSSIRPFIMQRALLFLYRSSLSYYACRRPYLWPRNNALASLF